MPKLTKKLPTYRKHRASGQAIVTLAGEDHYLGPFNTKASHLEYDRVVAEWLARGRTPIKRIEAAGGGISIVELIAAYLRHVRGYYLKDGKPTGEVDAIKAALKPLKELYGRELANDFGPLKLQAVQQAMLRLNWTRSGINRQTSRVKRLFVWGVSQELVRPDMLPALKSVDGFHKGRTTAREAAPVLPVDDSTINATLEHLQPIVADMVRLQRLTGARPEEVCMLRPCDIDASGPVWAYRPESHKTEHHGRERIIFIGPKGQDILRPYLLRDKAAYCFSPADAERKRRALMHERRRTPIAFGNVPGSNCKANPKWAAGSAYTTDSYRRAIHRACDDAFPAPEGFDAAAIREWQSQHRWSPNRLRHTAATEARKQFGLEAAQVMLGHASADITQVYAERDHAKAAEIMRQIG